MRNYFTVLFLSIFSVNIFAQKDSDIVGYYELKGGYHYLKPDHTFVLVGYATYVTGKWKLEQDGIVNFVPDYEKEAFTLYGREDPKLKNSSKIMLSYGFDDEETFINFGPLAKKDISLQRIFAKEQQTFTFPYVYNKSDLTRDISFTFLQYNQLLFDPNSISDIYKFSIENNFNDLIGVHTKITRYNQPFQYFFKDDKLYYNTESYAEKQDLNEALKESEMDLNDDEVQTKSDYFFITPKYNDVSYKFQGEPIESNYKFIPEKNAYVDQYYIEGQENDSKTDYNNTSIIYVYKIIPYSEIIQSKFKIIEKPLFDLPVSDVKRINSERKGR